MKNEFPKTVIKTYRCVARNEFCDKDTGCTVVIKSILRHEYEHQRQPSSCIYGPDDDNYEMQAEWEEVDPAWYDGGEDV